MKKLYVGLGISFALIIGGIAYGSTARPAVDMTKLSKIFYNQQGHYEIPMDNKFSYKLISIEEHTLKFTVNIEDYSGTEYLSTFIDRASYNLSNASKEDKKKVEKFFNDINKGKEPLKKGGDRITTKSEIINYKWANKPFNMSLAKVNEKAYKRRNGINDSYPVYNVLQQNGEIQLSGNIVIKKSGGRPELALINGIRGKGSLEIEYKVTY